MKKNEHLRNKHMLSHPLPKTNLSLGVITIITLHEVMTCM